MRESKLSTRGFISWFGLTLSHPYIHVVEALNQEYRFSAIIKSLLGLFLSRQRDLSSHRSHLDPVFTKELAHEGWGL